MPSFSFFSVVRECPQSPRWRWHPFSFTLLALALVPATEQPIRARTKAKKYNWQGPHGKEIIFRMPTLYSRLKLFLRRELGIYSIVLCLHMYVRYQLWIWVAAICSIKRRADRRCSWKHKSKIDFQHCLPCELGIVGKMTPLVIRASCDCVCNCAWPFPEAVRKSMNLFSWTKKEVKWCVWRAE